MRLELTRVGLLVELANHYTTRGALMWRCSSVFQLCNSQCLGAEFVQYNLFPLPANPSTDNYLDVSVPIKPLKLEVPVV